MMKARHPAGSDHVRPWVRGWFVAASFFLCGLAGQPVQADSLSARFDAPKLSPPIVSPDAVSLKPEEREVVATALTALVGNFAGETRIDMDVKEKALALALCLDPVHVEARRAYKELKAGGSLSQIPSYADPLVLGDTLWEFARQLVKRDRDFHDAKLARLLLELSLIVHPDPPEQWVGAYLVLLKRVGGKSVWEKTVKVNPVPGDGLSVLRSRIEPVFRKAFADAKAKQTAAANKAPDMRTTPAAPAAPAGQSAAPMVANPFTTPTPTTGAPAAPGNSPAPAAPMAPAAPVDTRPISEFKAEEASLSFVSPLPIRGAAVLGTVRFRVSDYDETEEALAGFFNANSGAKTEAFVKPDGEISMQGLEIVRTYVKRSYERWPGGKVIRASVKREGGVGRPGPAGPDVSLAGAMALESIFTGMTIDPLVAVGGRLLAGGKVDLRGDEVAMMTAAKAGGMEVMVLPKAERTRFRDAALVGDLQPFLRPQVIEVASMEELKSVIREDQPENVANAIRLFAEVQAAIADRPLQEMAANKFVQEKLQEVIALMEGHISARLLLAYGTRGDNETLSAIGSMDKVDAILKPLRDRFEAIGGVEVSDENEIHNEVRDAEKALRELTGLIDPRTKPYLDAAMDALGPVEAYLVLKNKETSIGQQKLDQAKEKVGTLLRIRTAMLEPSL